MTDRGKAKGRRGREGHREEGNGLCEGSGEEEGPVFAEDGGSLPSEGRVSQRITK